MHDTQPCLRQSCYSHGSGKAATHRGRVSNGPGRCGSDWLDSRSAGRPWGVVGYYCVSVSLLLLLLLWALLLWALCRCWVLVLTASL